MAGGLQVKVLETTTRDVHDMSPRDSQFGILSESAPGCKTCKTPASCKAAPLHTERINELEDPLQYCAVDHILAALDTPRPSRNYPIRIEHARAPATRVSTFDFHFLHFCFVK